MVLIGKQAPNFKAQAYFPETDSYAEVNTENLRGKYIILYWYPVDFTFVGASDLLVFSKLKGEFEKRNAVVIG